MAVPLLVAAATGCEGPLEPAVARPLTTRGTPAGAAETARRQPLPRFGVSLESLGPIRVREPVWLRLTVHTSLSGSRAEIRFLLIEAGSEGGALLGRRWVVASTAGDRWVHDIMLELPEPGTYRVLATARAADEPPVAAGRWVQNVAHAERWLHAEERTGRLTTHRPLVRAQRAVAATAGRPISLMPRSSRDLFEETVSDGGVIRLHYFDRDAGAYAAVAGALVEVTARESASGGAVGAFTARADSGGVLAMPCPAEGEHHEGRVMLADADLQVGFAPAATFVVDPATCTMNRTIEVDDEPAHAWRNMRLTIAASRATFGRPRGRIVVELVDGPTRYQSGLNGSPERIFLQRWSSIWGRWGAFAAAHEYGHALQAAALGGLVPTGADCAEHSLHSLESLGCAYSEGFADFHAVATRGAATGMVQYLEWNQGYFDARAITGGEVDGSRIESTVAAFLHDLIDPPNESYDSLALPGKYLADVIASCWVSPLYAGTGGRAAGVDHLTYCLERRIDRTVTGSPLWFATRYPDPSLFTEAAIEPAGWSASKIRAIWVRDLYAGLGPGTTTVTSSPVPPPEDQPCGGTIKC